LPPVFLIQLLEHSNNFFIIGRAVFHVTNDSFLINDNRASVKYEIFVTGHAIDIAQISGYVREQGKRQLIFICPVFEGCHIIPAYAHDLGVERGIVRIILLMPLHLARSDGCECRRKKCHNQVGLSIIIITIVH